jgi:hypothetical protein
MKYMLLIYSDPAREPGYGTPEFQAMMKGFFESRQFDKVAAETIAVAIIRQAKIDGYNPLQVVDTLKGMDGLSLNSVVSDILNYNRYKTSMLGHSLSNAPFEPIARNIVA